MNKAIRICAVGLAAAMSLAGCSARAGDTQPSSANVTRAALARVDGDLKEVIVVADPVQAIEAIYDSLDSQPALTELTMETVEDTLGVYTEDIEALAGYTSDFKKGLRDVVMILPAQGKNDDVRDALLKYIDKQAESFKNFDVLNAYEIASNAVVFNQGDYVVLLMLPDNEAAQELVSQYMPQ